VENVINFREFLTQDQILRKGDLVKLVNMETFEDLEDLEEMVGIVTEVETTFGEQSEARGQAATMTVAIPEEDDWTEITGVPIENVHRVIGPDCIDIREW
jgi:uncharacterized protein YaiE (UPF0345 family)